MTDKYYLVENIIKKADSEYKKNGGGKEEKEDVVSTILRDLDTLGLGSLASIKEMQNEVQKEINKREKSRNRFLNGIYIIFAVICWNPADYLMKELFNLNRDTLNWNNCCTLIGFLFCLAISGIVVYFLIYEVVDYVLNINVKSPRLVDDYLHNIKYKLINDKETTEKATFDVNLRLSGELTIYKNRPVFNK